jgi:hypothetical protein
MAIYKGMLGVAELMTDDNFLAWVEALSEEALSRPTEELYAEFKAQNDN